MDRILFIRLFQPFAQFRNPFTFFYAQTFPLPPKSTVLGFLENATGEYYSGNFDDIKISIWGYHSAIGWNYLRFIKGTPDIDEKGIVRGGDKRPLYGTQSSQRTPTRQQEIMGLNLFLFLKAEGEKLEKIEKALSSVQKVLYLGRGEDVVFIREAKLLKKDSDLAERRDLKDFYLKIGTYVKYPIENRSSSSFKMYPAYSIPLMQRFIDKDGGEKSIVTRQKILLQKDSLRRKVEFATVLYVENKQFKLPQPQMGVKFNYGDQNLGELTFYLIESISWL